MTDSARVRRLLTKSESIARTVDYPSAGHPDGFQSWALREVVTPLNRLDLPTAERIALGISGEYAQGRRLRDIVRNVAGTDPHYAEDMVSRITNPIRRAQAGALVAGALAEADPGQARHSLVDAADLIFARDVHPWLQARTLTKIAEVAV